jgi:hypothetical protein
MRLAKNRAVAAFTLSELAVATAIGVVLCATTVISSIALQKSFRATDNFFASEIQQIRVVDYLDRDIKRGLSVVTSTDLSTVTMTVPNYIIKAGDPEATADASLIGTPRTPTITMGPSGPQVNYGSTPSTVVYAISGNTVARTENGAVTNVSTSASQLLPTTTDVQLANTEYSKTSVTFLPIFSSSNALILRTATTVYSTAYLRNKRRG